MYLQNSNNVLSHKLSLWVLAGGSGDERIVVMELIVIFSPLCLSNDGAGSVLYVGGCPISPWI